ncbi:hypothetical protein [Candidatus Magnetominusculus dajiuhuensis]|uniref:hypothetical protein n=1 Tax=Candidatus Magnetominusculus dajiuhuensis TaxID=3137712 RepID=UPI003B43456C
MKKYMEQLNVLNISLLLVVLFMGVYDYYNFKKKETIRVSPSKNMRLDTDEVKFDDAKKLLARGDYMVVTEKNVFHPDRKPVKSQPDAPLPEFIVYGTITGESRAAFVEDKKTPYSTTGRGQRQRLLHEGDSVGGYKVSIITTDYVEFTKDGDKLVIKVFDFDKKKVRQAGDSTRTAAAAAAAMPTPLGSPTSPQITMPQPSPIPQPPTTIPMPPPGAHQNPVAKNPMSQMPLMPPVPSH